MIRINKFGGISPKVDPANLPEGMAQIAHNCNVSGGALSPIAIPDSRVSLHEDGALKSGVAESEIKRLGKPDAPAQVTPVSLGAFERLGLPTGTNNNTLHWLMVLAYGFTRTTNLSTGITGSIVSNSLHLTPYYRNTGLPIINTKVEFNDSGFDLLFEVLPWHLQDFSVPTRLEVWAPRFQVGVLYESSSVAQGYGVEAFKQLNGPRNDTLPSLAIPLTVTPGSGVVTPYPIPLYNYETNSIYAHLQLKDAICDVFDGTYEYQSGYSLVQNLSGILRFDLNYVEPRRKFFYYASSVLDGDDRESRPSSLSEKILVRPGMKNIIKVSAKSDQGNASKARLYRSMTGGDDFELIAEPSGDPIVSGGDRYYLVSDLNRHTRREPIPPFGDAPTDQITDFLEGAFWHPGAFVVAKWNDEGKGTVWFSDKERPHAFPKEYSVPFSEEIKAIALTGNTVLVFTESPGRVYGVTGMDPRSMSKQLLTESAPLLNKLSLGKIGDTVYYATHDGIAAASGGSVQVISGAHLTNEQWQSFSPNDLTIETGDNSLILTAEEPTSGWPSNGFLIRLFPAIYPGSGTPPTDAINVLYDLEEEQARMVTFDAGGGDVIYKTKLYEFPEPTAIDFVRVVADAPVHITPSADGEDLPEVTCNGKVPVAVTEAFARTWDFTLRTSGVVRQFEAFDRQIIPVANDVTLNPETSPCWRATRLSFPDRGSFCAGSITIQGEPDADATVTLTPNEGDEILCEVRNGYFPIETSAVVGNSIVFDDIGATEWTVDVLCDSRVEELKLFTRKPEPAQGVIREVHNGVVPPWAIKRYQLPKKMKVASVIVHAKENVTMFANGVSLGTFTSGVEKKGDAIPVTEELRFDFPGKNHLVRDLQVYLQEPIPADNGLKLTGPNWLNINALFQGREKWAVARVKAENPVTITASGQTPVIEVAPQEAFPLPRSWNEQVSWMLDFACAGRIEEAIMLPWRTVDAKDSVRSLNYEGIPEWMFTRYEFADRRTLNSVTVHASSYPVYLEIQNEQGTPVDRVAVPDRKPISLNHNLSAFTYSFFTTASGSTRADNLVQEVIFLAASPIMVTSDGLNLSGLPSYMNIRVWFPACEQWACGIVKAKTYPVTVDIAPGWSGTDGAVSITVADAAPFLLPRTLIKASQWRVSVSGAEASEIEHVTLMPWRRESFDGAIRLFGGTELPPWLFTKYELPDTAMLTSMKVHCDTPVTARLYMDYELDPIDVDFYPEPGDEDTPDPVSNEAEVALSANISAVDFHFVHRESENLIDCKLDEVMLFSEPEQLVGEEPIMRAGQVNYQGLRYRFPEESGFAWVDVSADRDAQVVLNGENNLGAVDYTPEKHWTVGVYPSDAIVKSMILYPWRVAPTESVIRGIGGGSLPPNWVYTIWEYPAKVTLRSVWVDAVRPVRLKIDGVFQTDAISSGEHKLTGVSGGRFRFRFEELNTETGEMVSADHLVREMLVYAEEIVPITHGGIALRGAPPGTPWRNKTLVFPETGAWDVARVRATDYDFALSLNGVEYQVDDDIDFILNTPYSREWILDLARADEVQELILIPREIQRVEQGLWRMRREEEPFSWLCKRVECAAPVSWTCARVVVEKDQYPVRLKIYEGDSTSTSYSVNVSSPRAFRLPKLSHGRKWRVDAEGEGIREVALATSMERLRYD